MIKLKKRGRCTLDWAMLGTYSVSIGCALWQFFPTRNHTHASCNGSMGSRSTVFQGSSMLMFVPLVISHLISPASLLSSLSFSHSPLTVLSLLAPSNKSFETWPPLIWALLCHSQFSDRHVQGGSHHPRLLRPLGRGWEVEWGQSLFPCERWTAG